ncbi:MAG: peptidase C39 family protein [Candidatus Woesearchaeota archaeon]
MKLDVPYHASKKDTDCGPLALKMVLEFFGEQHEFAELSHLERQLDTGLVWSAGIARAAIKLGFTSTFITKTVQESIPDNEYYDTYALDDARAILQQLTFEIKKAGVEIRQLDLSLAELLGSVSEDSIPIVLVNWNVIRGKKGFSGHFLPITGYDEQQVYVHNPGLDMAASHLPIDKVLFLKAWETKGTDKDVVIIYRKRSLTE